jgi:hypothetical protein
MVAVRPRGPSANTRYQHSTEASADDHAADYTADPEHA